MSLSIDGRTIYCDGEGCGAIANVPVSLYPTKMAGATQNDAAHGWLFLIRPGGCLHYCPACARCHLAHIQNGINCQEPCRTSSPGPA